MSTSEKDPFEGIPLEEPPGFLDRFDPRMLVGIAAGSMAMVLLVGFTAVLLVSRSPQSPAASTDTPPGPTITPSPSAALTTTTVPVITLPALPTIDAAATNLAATVTNIPDLRFANLSEIVGIVRIKNDALPDWMQIDKDLTILPGTSVLTDENSSVKITLSQGGLIRLGSQTQFTLVEMSGTKADPVSILRLEFGKLWAIVASPLVGRMEVRLPVGVAAVRGTFMSVEHNTTDSVEIVTCLEGRCWYENSNGGVELTTNQQTESINGSPPSAPHRMDRNQNEDWGAHVSEVKTLTPTRTPTNTPTQTFTPSLTFTPSNTFTPSPTVPTNTPTSTFTPTKTFTPTSTFTPTHTPTVTPGPPIKLGFVVQPPSSATAGAPFSVRVAIQDVFGITVPYAGATVNIAISANPGGGTLGGTTSVGTVNGIADFPNLSINKSGVGYTLVASATGLANGTSVAFNIVPGPANSLEVTGIPPTVTAGTASSLMVSAKDSNGNTATGYAGTITFSSSDPQSLPGNGLPANYTFTGGDAGVHTFNNVILKTAGPQSVRATDTSAGTITGSQSGINVVHGPPFRLLVSGVTDPICIDTPSSVTVTVKDEFGNTVTNYAETITFSSSDPDPGATLPSDYTFKLSDNGVVTLSSVIFKTENILPGHTVTSQTILGTSPFIWGEQRDISVYASGGPCP